MTVSRVLNEHPNIRETTRNHVLRVIEEMNYKPSSIARSLATRRAHRIGALVDDPVQNGPNSTLRALEQAARRSGYTVSAYSTSIDGASQADFGVRELVRQGVEALCVIGPRESSINFLRQQPNDLPTVVIKAEAEAAWYTVGVDQRKGTQLAVQHLLDLGHRNIAHLAGPVDGFDARERLESWRECLTMAGLSEGPVVFGDWTSDSGFEFGQSFSLGDTTAVFAANDELALGAIHGFHNRGIRVPEDLSIVGFDDSPSARYFLPPLTTVRQDFALLGEVALRQIIAAIERDAEPSHETVQPQLIVRESTKVLTRG